METMIGREVLDMEILVWGIVQKVEAGKVFLKSDEYAGGEWVTDIDNIVLAIRKNGLVDVVSVRSNDDIPF